MTEWGGVYTGVNSNQEFYSGKLATNSVGGGRRLVRVTFEAIDIDCSVQMAASTKILGTFGSHNITVTGYLDVAVNTARQAVFFGANTAKNRFVALVLEKLHVITTHNIDWFHALLRVIGEGRLGYYNLTEA